MIESLILMLTKRWYVFTFLAAYLGIATYHWGVKRTLKFLVIGYFVAWASEASSIRNGFPYGFYFYKDAALVGEPRILGVPFWDSLAYPFLCFAGWMTSLWIAHRWRPLVSLNELQRSGKVLLGGVFLTVLLDVVIDPVAHLGERWFLGDIYGYPPGGEYFDVPLTNFAGWFLVSLTTLVIFRLTDSLKSVPRGAGSVVLGGLLFWGVYFFNVGITGYLREWKLLGASLGWGGLVVFLLMKKARVRRSSAAVLS